MKNENTLSEKDITILIELVSRQLSYIRGLQNPPQEKLRELKSLSIHLAKLLIAEMEK